MVSAPALLRASLLRTAWIWASGWLARASRSLDLRECHILDLVSSHFKVTNELYPASLLPSRPTPAPKRLTLPPKKQKRRPSTLGPCPKDPSAFQFPWLRCTTQLWMMIQPTIPNIFLTFLVYLTWWRLKMRNLSKLSSRFNEIFLYHVYSVISRAWPFQER